MFYFKLSCPTGLHYIHLAKVKNSPKSNSAGIYILIQRCVSQVAGYHLRSSHQTPKNPIKGNTFSPSSSD